MKQKVIIMGCMIAVLLCGCSKKDSIDAQNIKEVHNTGQVDGFVKAEDAMKGGVKEELKEKEKNEEIYTYTEEERELGLLAPDNVEDTAENEVAARTEIKSDVPEEIVNLDNWKRFEESEWYSKFDVSKASIKEMKDDSGNITLIKIEQIIRSDKSEFMLDAEYVVDADGPYIGITINNMDTGEEVLSII